MRSHMARSKFSLTLSLLFCAAACSPSPLSDERPAFSVKKEAASVLLLDPEERPMLGYRVGSFQRGERAPNVVSVGFIHPLYTPAGVLVTDLAPDDHPHHRGVFVGWVEMSGKKQADFWGWGAKAPIENRHIRNQALEVRVSDSTGVILDIHNLWLAENEKLLQEFTTLHARQSGQSNIVDLEFQFVTPGPSVRIEANAFGGFCYRASPRGEAMVTGPAGPVKLPDAVSDQAEANWPNTGWYDLTYRSPEGKVSGAAVMSHPQNPPTSWFVHRGLHMVNPCVVATEPVQISVDTPLTLRYRLVAHDGELTPAKLGEFYEEFSRP